MNRDNRVVKGYGAVFVSDGEVTVNPPEDYPAFVGVHVMRGGKIEAIMDYIYLSSRKDLDKLIEKVGKMFGAELEQDIERVAKQLYGEVDDVDVLKAGWQLGVKRYGRKRAARGVVGYEEWPGYVGLSRKESLEINNWLWDMAFTRRTLDLRKLVNGLVEEFMLDEQQAENIVRTELANIFNKMREWAYTRETGVKKFKWVAKHDACEKCREVELRTAEGVSLKALKAIIRKVGGKHAREWTVHPQCRCTFVRAEGAARG